MYSFLIGPQWLSTRTSEANHGNVTPSISEKDRDGEFLAGGVTIDRAEQTIVLSFPALRRLRFPINGEAQSRLEVDVAARTVLAALGLCAAALAAAAGVSATFGVLANRAATEARENAQKAHDAEQAARDEQAKTLQANQQLERVADLQRRTRYAAEMNLVQSAYTAGNLSEVGRLLEAQRPKPGESDLRGFEWHYLNRNFHQYDQETRIDLPGVGTNLDLETEIALRNGGRFINRGKECRIWDLSTGEFADYSDSFRDEQGQFVSFSPDLQWYVSHTKAADPNDSRVVIRTVTDGKEVFSVTGVFNASAYLSPDRKHVLLRYNSEQLKPFDPNTPNTPPKITLACWAIGNEKPLWKWDSDNPRRQSDLRFSLDGSRFFTHLTEEGKLMLKTHETTTGKVLNSTLIGPEGEDDGVNSIDDRPIEVDQAQRWVTISQANGLKAVPIQKTDAGMGGPFGPPRRWGTTLGVNLESLDGFPMSHRFAPDGRVVTLHASNGQAVIRCWTIPTLAVLKDDLVTFGVGTHSPDRQLIAVPTYVHNSNWVRGTPLAVYDNLGNLRLGVPFPSYAPQYPCSLDFSADSRYLFGLPSLVEVAVTQEPLREEENRPPPDPHPLLVWDLQTKKESLRITPTPGNWLCQAVLSPDRQSLLVTECSRAEAKRCSRADGVNPGPPDEIIFNPMIAVAKVYAFPSGRLLTSLQLPDGEPIDRLAFYQHAIVTYPKEPGQPEPVHRWNPQTGEYLGKGMNEEVEVTIQHAGERVLRFTRRASATQMELFEAGESWDKLPPILSEQLRGFGALPSLDPTGTRFIAPMEEEFRLYCAITGRRLVTLNIPPMLNPYFSAQGLWSADGTQFWYAVDSKGKLVGFDARPLPEPKP
jgi:hypothetical protein